MQDSTSIGIEPQRPSRWSIVPPVAAAGLTLWVLYAAGYLFPALWEWKLTGLPGMILIGVAAGWIAPRGRQWPTFGVLAGALGLLTLIYGSGWFYYSLLFVPVVLVLRWGVLAIGYGGGLYLRRFPVRRWTMLAVLSGLMLTEVTWLLARDGYLLIRHARHRLIASEGKASSWFFFSPGERAAGLTYIAQQHKATDPAAARRIFQKAVSAAEQIRKENHMTLVMIAQGQVGSGFFEDAEGTILRIEDPIQFNLYYPIIAAEMAKQGGQSYGQRLFERAIRAANGHREQHMRDRELYLIGYRQWEGGMFSVARQTAELIQTADSKADLLDRLNDSSQLEVARQQAGSRRFGEAEATIKQNVKDPYRYCDGLINTATAAATNAQPADARRIFDHALRSAQQIESPTGRNDVIAQITLRQRELGFQAESQQTLTLITHAGIKDELLKKLARVKPVASNL